MRAGGAGPIALLVLAACQPQSEEVAERSAPTYEGVEARSLAEDLIQVVVTMGGARGAEDILDYAECAAARFTLAEGFGFARQVRTEVKEEGGVWRADAIYTISPVLPRGLKTIDADVAVQDCRDRGIPTV